MGIRGIPTIRLGDDQKIGGTQLLALLNTLESIFKCNDLQLKATIACFNSFLIFLLCFYFLINFKFTSLIKIQWFLGNNSVIYLMLITKCFTRFILSIADTPQIIYSLKTKNRNYFILCM